MVNWLLPGASSVLVTTIAYGPVSHPQQAYQFGVREGFDHLYR